MRLGDSLILSDVLLCALEFGLDGAELVAVG